jgi:Protein of unknown function (DUF3551)
MTRLLSYGLVLSALGLAATPAAAQWAPWCLFESGNRGSGAVTCTFHTFQQCQETRIGIGGSCGTNPYLSYGAPHPQVQTRKRR